MMERIIRLLSGELHEILLQTIFRKLLQITKRISLFKVLGFII